MQKILQWFAVPLDIWLGRWAALTLFCSIFSVMIPPIEIWSGFPRFQKCYALFVNIVNHYGALNLRGKMVAAALRSSDYEGQAKSLDMNVKKGVE